MRPPLWERIYGRRAARRYWHMAPHRSCNGALRGFCLRCFWRDTTGQTERARLDLIAFMRERRP